MPAGDLINTSIERYQVEIRSYLVRTGQDWWVQPEDGGIRGLEVVNLENVYKLEHDDGVVVGPEFAGPLLLTWRMVCTQDSISAAEAVLTDLETAFARTNAPIPLHLFIPGKGHFSVSGYPRDGLSPDRSRVAYGLIETYAKFFVPNPVITLVSPP